MWTTRFAALAAKPPMRIVFADEDSIAESHARAREEQADKLFREIIEIADDASGDYVTTSDGKTIVDHENIQRSRLRVDARQWAAARLAAGPPVGGVSSTSAG